MGCQTVTLPTVLLRLGVAANQVAHVLARVDEAAKQYAPVDVLTKVRRQGEFDPWEAHGAIIEFGRDGCQGGVVLPFLTDASPRSSLSSNCPHASSARRLSSK